MPEPGRGLVLVGLPGSGKTTVGRLVAERLARPFHDTDEIIAARTGVPAAAYLSERGERAFRDVEAAALDEACADGDAVVATGGGALIDPLSRWRLWSHGPAVWLRTAEPVLLARLALDPTPRPLLAASPAERLAALAAERAPYYRAADASVEAGADPRRVAEAVAELAGSPAGAGRRLYDGLEPRHHPIGPSEARIVYGDGILGTLASALDELGGRPSLVVDRRVAAGLDVPVARRLDVAGGERAKRMRSLERVLGWLAAEGAERGDPLVGMGGGTIGDLGGLAAALYGRGVPYVAVPTTWLAQADAALGGKVGIDLPAGKNLVGAFWPAWALLADVAFLRTLPRARLRDGLAEAIKAAIVGDPILWRLIAERGADALNGDEAVRYAITERAARVKLGIVRRDPFEAGERRQLNLGHTIGHALEAASGYRLSHGAAVALGLRGAATISAGRGGDADLLPALDKLLATLGLRLRHRFDPHAVRRAMGADKKRSAGRQRWLLPMRIGEVVEVDDVTDVELTTALRVIAQD
jgi:shikimate kinase / 3-dehydroquinate synthase